MSLTRLEAWKCSFIKQCHDEGLTQESQVLDRIQQEMDKQAGLAEYINKMHQNFVNPKPGESGSLLGLGALHVGLPVAAGAGVGVLASKLKGNYLDTEDVQKQELIDELRRQTSLAQQYKRLGGSTPHAG